MAELSVVQSCVTATTPTSVSCAQFAELMARLQSLESDVCILAARDAILNESKWEIVDFPASEAADGEAGQIAVNSDNIAIYVDGVGWKFGALTNTILP